MTPHLLPPIDLRRTAINPCTFALRAFVASVKFARRHPAMADVYYATAYGFLAERVRLEEQAR